MVIIQSHHAAQMTSVQDATVSSPIQIQQSAISSTSVSMANIPTTNAAVDFTLMNIQALASGQQQPTEKAAMKPRKNLRTASHVQRTRTRMMPMAKLLLIHTFHIRKIVRNSTCVLTESNHVSWDVLLARFSMTILNVAMLLKMFPDGKELAFIPFYSMTCNFLSLYSEDWYKDADKN